MIVSTVSITRNRCGARSARRRSTPSFSEGNPPRLSLMANTLTVCQAERDWPRWDRETSGTSAAQLIARRFLKSQRRGLRSLESIQEFPAETKLRYKFYFPPAFLFYISGLYILLSVRSHLDLYLSLIWFLGSDYKRDS